MNKEIDICAVTYRPQWSCYHATQLTNVEMNTLTYAR